MNAHMAKRTVTVDIKRRYRNQVRLCRLRAGIPTVAILARVLGISRSMVSELEHQRRFLCAPHALVIAEALKCRLDDLYLRVEEPPRQTVSTMSGLSEKLRAAETASAPCPTCGRCPTTRTS